MLAKARNRKAYENLLVITGFQRSGTTAFGEMLGTAQNAVYFGEIFHPDGLTDTPSSRDLRLHPEANYFNFINDLTSCPAPLSDAALAQRWADYRHHLDAVAGGLRPIIDIKYNSWFNIVSTWQAPNRMPRLMELVAMDSATIVLHCLRSNLLHQALSEVIASTTGRYTRPLATRARKQRIMADPAMVLGRMRDSRQQTAIVTQWMQHVRHLTLTYETMFDATGALSDHCRAVMGPHVPEALAASDRPVLLRAVSNHAARITNIEDVLAHLKDSEFADEMDAWAA